MKLKSIAALCKRAGRAIIFEEYNEEGNVISQYIGEGMAAYPTFGLPTLDAESLLTIFDVPEQKRGDLRVQVSGIPKGINFEDVDDAETWVEWERLTIAYAGKKVIPLRTRSGIVCIETRYLSPLDDMLGKLDLFERIALNGTSYVVAKMGFLLQAVILPCRIVDQPLVDKLRSITRACEIELEAKRKAEEEREAEAGQTSMNIDLDTGEIVEEEPDGRGGDAE